jgi:GntR family transcriptional regulator
VIIRLDPSSAVPPYEQLRAQIAEMIASGVLEKGDRLPPIRQLAGDLGIAEGTVARAYRELDRDGWIDSRRRHGSFVRRPATAAPRERERVVREAAAAFAVRITQAGADPTEALKIARDALRSMSG